MKYGANTEQQLQKNNKYSERTGHNCKNHIKPVWNTTGTKKKKKRKKGSHSCLEKKGLKEDQLTDKHPPTRSNFSSLPFCVSY